MQLADAGESSEDGKRWALYGSLALSALVMGSGLVVGFGGLEENCAGERIQATIEFDEVDAQSGAWLTVRHAAGDSFAANRTFVAVNETVRPWYQLDPLNATQTAGRATRSP
jgi:hypothetical protein